MYIGSNKGREKIVSDKDVPPKICGADKVEKVTKNFIRNEENGICKLGGG
jgi:hypothetical protein